MGVPGGENSVRQGREAETQNSCDKGGNRSRGAEMCLGAMGDTL